MTLFAADAETVATSQTALAVALTTALGGMITIATLIVNKWAENRKQAHELTAKQQDLDAAKGKLDADAVVARARIEADANLALAKIEFDSKFTTITNQHKICEENHAALALKLDECEKRHVDTEEKVMKFEASTSAKIAKFEEFLRRIPNPHVQSG